MKNNGFPAESDGQVNSPTLSLNGLSSSNRSPQRLQDVSAGLHHLTDVELEIHINNCAYLMERAYADYEAHGCFADRGTADRWRILRDEAVKARSPAKVLALEIKRGHI